jgi:hypothetical protein
MDKFEELCTTIAIELRGADAAVALNATICNVAAVIVAAFEEDERKAITESVIHSLHRYIEVMERKNNENTSE